MSFIQELTRLLPGAVQTQNLETYTKDWSLFSIMPSMVVAPKNSADIQTLVKLVSQYKKDNPELSVTVRAAGTDMTGGPLNNSIIVDVMQDITGIQKVERTVGGMQKSFYGHNYAITGEAVVLPGTFYRDFEKETRAQNLILPCYPASKDICAMGGMVANNGAGERTLKYGQNKDFVKKLRVVLSDGNEYLLEPLTFAQLQATMSQDTFLGKIYSDVYTLIKNNWNVIQDHKPKTSKNAAGYYIWDVIQAPSIEKFEEGIGFFDPTKLVVGAQGTTGIITEITYKLVDEKPSHDLLVVYVKDLTVVPELVKRLMKYDLEMLEMYDDNTFKIGIKFFKDFIRDKGFWGAIKYSIRFFPEVWMAFTQGVPRLIVLAEFTGQTETEVHAVMTQAEHSIHALDVSSRRVTSDIEEEKFWDFRHDSFKILTEHSSKSRHDGAGSRTAPFIDDIAVNPEHLPEYLPKLIEILDSYELLYTIAGHLGNGNFHIIPLMDINEIGDGKKILEISDKVYNLALQYGATLTAEHNDGIIRTPYLEKQFGPEMVELFTQVKNIFDPQDIFNPRKKVKGSFQDIQDALS
ncbi:MAG: FAD-binding oxidoreductase [Candidatus Pacebacteria bacterium]|nr:FAD-binding oxidoreductase [Candidatus Paceibacterota bacterium]